MVMKVLRSSFPRICGAFLKNGQCSKEFCGYFHICPEFVNGTCPTGTCNLAERSGQSKSLVHTFTTHHNKRVFSMFLPDHWKICRDVIAPNILIRPENGYPYNVHNAYQAQESISSQTQSYNLHSPDEIQLRYNRLFHNRQ